MSGQKKLRLVLVDDHQLMREGIRSLLAPQSDMVITGEAASLAEVSALEADPEIVVCDLVLPDGRGADVVRVVGERFPKASILVLTMVDNPSDVQLVFGAGARGYLLKGAASTDLVDAIRRVARGEDYVHPSLGAALAGLKRVAGQAHAAASVPLSEREQEVLRLVALGHTNAEIAQMLFVSVRTVESHRASLMNKLGLRTRAELVRYAREQGVDAEG